MLKRPPYYIDAIGHPGDLAALTGIGEYQGYMALLSEADCYDKRVVARVALKAVRYTTGETLRKIRVPVLVQLGLKDKTTSARATLRLCRNVKADNVSVRTYDLGHFDVYVAPAFANIVGDQIRFLKRVFGK